MAYLSTPPSSPPHPPPLVVPLSPLPSPSLLLLLLLTSEAVSCSGRANPRISRQSVGLQRGERAGWSNWTLSGNGYLPFSLKIIWILIAAGDLVFLHTGKFHVFLHRLAFRMGLRSWGSRNNQRGGYGGIPGNISMRPDPKVIVSLLFLNPRLYIWFITISCASLRFSITICLIADA